ncbi:MAG TPA: hypothetical protein VGC32_12465 [Solirubrobacterales bacterium]
MRTRYRKILVTAALTALALTAVFASAANAATPAPPYQDFAGCPSEAENEFIGICEKVEFTGGNISFGSRNIPISSTMVLRGGSESLTGDFVFNGEGGLTAARQQVPGGVIGMTGLKWLDAFSEKQLKLYATVELAGQLGSTFEPTLSVPVKVHLESPLLGKGCYVGSNANPINLDLTTGTTNPPLPNHPISGHFGSSPEPEAARPEVSVSNGGLFVDNAYAVPAASGCKLEAGGYSISLDSAVNSQYKLPAAAGTNETALDFNVAFVAPFVVYP